MKHSDCKTQPLLLACPFGIHDGRALRLTRRRRRRIVPLDIFTVPDGLEVTVWAQSPMLKNPTNIDIDAAGRIWVTEGVNYRRHKERDPKGDRVVVLEDTDGDGRADKSTTFVQEPTLVAPLGIAVIGNQVIVSNAPDLIVYTDVDGDRVFNPAVDKREVLLTGFDGRNHDHALHSVTFGPDGRWYFSQGNAGAYFTDRGGKTFRVGSRVQPGAGWWSAAGVRIGAAELRRREERRWPCVRRRLLGAHAAERHGRRNPRASTSATATSRPSPASATSSTTTTTIRRPAALPT